MLSVFSMTASVNSVNKEEKLLGNLPDLSHALKIRPVKQADNVHASMW